MSSDNGIEREALHKLSTAFLINIIFDIAVLAINGMLIGFTLRSLLLLTPYPPPSHSPEIYLASLLPGIIIGLIGALLYLYYLWKGFSLMEKIVSFTSSGKTGVILVAIGTILSSSIFPVSYAFFLSPNMNFEPLMFYVLILSIIGILSFIGLILIAITLFKLGERYDSTIIKAGAILFIFLGIVGAILLYIGFKDVENKPPKEKAIVLPPSPPW